MLEKKFGLYLKSKGVSPLTQKNYLSDLRYFWNWFVLVLKSKKLNVDKLSTPSLCGLITQEIVARYKKFLTLNQVPSKTINRRLSTLRKFCQFCISQGWLKENPAKKITNIGKKKDPIWEILKKFSQSLKEEGATKITIKNYLADVRQFLNWLEGIN